MSIIAPLERVPAPRSDERKPPMSVSSHLSLTARAIWVTCARALAFLLSLALPLLLVRQLDQSEFGLYRQVFLVVGTAITILPFGFGLSAFYFLPRERDRRRQIVFNIVLLHAAAGGLACLTLIFYPRLLELAFNDSRPAAYAPFIGVIILFWVIATFLDHAPLANQDAKPAALFTVSGQLTRTVLLLAAAVSLGSVVALLWAAILYGVVQTITLILYLRSRFSGFWKHFDWPTLRMQSAYVVPFACAGILGSFANDLHSYLVSHRFGADTYAVYAIGCFQVPLVHILNSSIASVLMPKINVLQQHDRRRDIILLTARVTSKLAAIYFPIYVLLMVVGPEFIAVLFTERYRASWPIFAVNLTLLPTSIVLFDPIARAYADQRYFFLKAKGVLFVLLPGVLWVATARFGPLGAISVSVTAVLVENLIAIVRLGRILGVTRSDFALLRNVAKLAAISLFAGVVTACVRSLVLSNGPFATLLISGMTFLALYVAGVLVGNIVGRDDFEVFREVFGRVRPASPVDPSSRHSRDS